MSNLAANSVISRLLFRCTLRGEESSCAKIDRILLLLRVSRRLEDLFPVPEIVLPPTGPDPSPIRDFKDLLSEVDPDGTPARLFSKGLSKDIKVQLKMATEMSKALQVIMDDLDVHIKELRAS
jgi:hypothetical protein